MKAKDTVMSKSRATYWDSSVPEEDRVLVPYSKVKEQAEISFKAGMKYGIWLFAWWKDGVQYVGTSGRTLEEAYKELGLDGKPN